MLITRRAVVAGSAALSMAGLASRIAFAQSQAGPFKLDPLPYPTDALEPVIDARTMELHHDKHHATYVKTLNEAIKDQPRLADMPLQDLLAKLQDVPESIRTTVRNNAGGHANHTMFWQIMGPSREAATTGQQAGAPSGGAAPAGELAQAIERDLGGMQKLQNDFNTAGEKLFGSGWVFVTVARDGKLAIESKPNQDTPLMDAKRVLMGNDMWEHAYYLTYQNRRPDYLKAWWKVVDWSKVAERYAAAKAGRLTI